MAIVPMGTLADLAVALPQVHEGGAADSCPDQDSLATGLPLPLTLNDLANHAREFRVPLDGLGLRHLVHTATIETGIEHTGPALPPLDCSSAFVVTCSTAGSRVHDLVRVEPLSGA
jgi:hypothetical protein